jgi:release factor glutamine methyltransferase
MTIKELLNKGVDFLGRDREGNVLDAEVLLAFVLDVDKEYLFAHDDEEVAEDFEKLFWHYLKKVQAGEPVAYITQEKEFFGLNFFVDDRVLIPRPETEHMVEEAVTFIEEHDTGERVSVLDVGTGSGNIAVAIAKYFEAQGSDVIEKIDALDIEDGAVEVAHLNVDQHNVDHLVNVFQSDLLEVVPEGEFYDVIVANLPYIGEVKRQGLSDSTEKYEPTSALFAGDDGLDLYRRMFEEMREKNIRYNIMFGEFGFGQSEDLAEVLNEFFDESWEIKQDLAGIERYFIVYA